MKRFGSGRAATLSLLCLALLAAAVRLQSEQPKKQAILLRGPYAVKGIPFLPPNTLPAYRCEYEVEETSVEVFLTREPLILPRQWRTLRCAAERFVEVPSDKGFAVCYADPEGNGYYLFFSFSGQDPPWCPFVESFLQRFLYLANFFQNAPEAPFPAVFDLRG